MKFPKFLRIANEYNYQLETANKTAILQERPIYFINRKLINILARIFGFSYKLVSPNDNEFGRLLPNGSWTGMIGMIYRGDADLIIDELSITESRSNVIDFSLPYHIDRWTFATRFMKKPRSNTSFLKPFTFEVWLAIIICFSLATLVDYVLCRKNIFKNEFKKGVLYSLSSAYHKDKCGLYIMNAGRLISETFLRFFYSSVLLSVFVMPSSSNVRNIPQLAKAVRENRYQCTSYYVYHVANILQNSQDSNFQIIGHSLWEYTGKRDIESVLKEKRLNKNIAYISTDSHLKSLRKLFFVSKDGFLPDLISIGMHKDFCCKDQIDSALNYILASGIFKKYIDYDFFHKVIRPLFILEEENAYKPLSLKDFKGLFVLASIGYIVSIFTFFIEVSVNKFYAKRPSSNDK